MGISERTVKAHLTSIYNKLGVDSETAGCRRGSGDGDVIYNRNIYRFARSYTGVLPFLYDLFFSSVYDGCMNTHWRNNDEKKTDNDSGHGSLTDHALRLRQH